MDNIILEVGMNSGQHTQGLIDTYDGILHGFEPVPKCQADLKKKFGNNPRIRLYDKAVGIENTHADFILSTPHSPNVHNFGCSSLFEFNKDIDKLWPGRTDFKEFGRFEVEVITIATFLEGLEFAEISYLHCDAQGNDLNVLKGFGDFISRLKAGVVEVALDVALYGDTGNSLDEARAWLENNGFEIERIRPDKHNAEANLFFKRK